MTCFSCCLSCLFRLLDQLLADERTLGLARVTAGQLSSWKNMSVVKTCLNTICFDSCSAAQLWRHCTHVTPLLNFARRSHPVSHIFVSFLNAIFLTVVLYLSPFSLFQTPSNSIFCIVWWVFLDFGWVEQAKCRFTAVRRSLRFGVSLRC